MNKPIDALMASLARQVGVSAFAEESGDDLEKRLLNAQLLALEKECALLRKNAPVDPAEATNALVRINALHTEIVKTLAGIEPRFVAAETGLQSLDERLATNVAAISERVATMTPRTEIAALVTRVDTLETNAPAVTNRLDAANEKLSSIEGRLDAIEATPAIVVNEAPHQMMMEHPSAERVEQIEERIEALEAQYATDVTPIVPASFSIDVRRGGAEDSVNQLRFSTGYIVDVERDGANRLRALHVRPG